MRISAAHYIILLAVPLLSYAPSTQASVEQVKKLKRILICGPYILAAPETLKQSDLQQQSLVSIINKFRLGGADIIDTKSAYRQAAILTGKQPGTGANQFSAGSFTKRFGQLTPEQKKKAVEKIGFVGLMQRQRYIEKQEKVMAEKSAQMPSRKKDKGTDDKTNALVTSLCPKDNDKTDKNVLNATFYKLLSNLKAESFLFLEASFREKNDPKAGEARIDVSYYDSRGKLIWRTWDEQPDASTNFLSGSSTSDQINLLRSTSEATIKVADALRVKIYK